MHVAVITGDVINSRQDNLWINHLKEALNRFGVEPKHWEIYRGDSFQLELKPTIALEAAIIIKASLKQQQNIDARMAIGIGEKSYEADSVSMSNGSAFIHSGECFEELKKRTLVIKTAWPSFDHQMNLLLELALLVMDNWQPATAKIIKAAMEYPSLNQVALANKLSRSQSTVSEALKRAGFEQIKKVIREYKHKLEQL